MLGNLKVFITFNRAPYDEEVITENPHKVKAAALIPLKIQ